MIPGRPRNQQHIRTTSTPGKHTERRGPGWAKEVGDVLADVSRERLLQVQMYGTNAHTPDGNGPGTIWADPIINVARSAYAGPLGAAELEALFREDYEDFQEEAGYVTWVHLLREEFAEVAKESDGRKLYDELIQLAALCVSQAQQLRDRDYQLLHAPEED